MEKLTPMPKPGINDIRKLISDLEERVEHMRINTGWQDAIDPGTLPEIFAPCRRAWKALDSAISRACAPDRFYSAPIKKNDFGYEEIPEGLPRKLKAESDVFNRHEDRLSGLAANE